MTENEKALYDEEDPEVPADLFSLWAKTEFADDETEPAEQEHIADTSAESDEPAESDELAGDEAEAVAGEAIADDTAPESAEATLGDDELAYLTSAGDTAETSVEQENIPELADNETEAAVEQEQTADTPAESDEPADNEIEAVVSEAITADAAPDSAEATLDDDELAYLTSAGDTAETSAEQEIIPELTDDEAESAEQNQIPEIPAESDELANNETEAAVSEAITADATSDSAEATLDDDELAYLTSTGDAAETSAEQEIVPELADDAGEPVAGQEQITESPEELTEATMGETESVAAGLSAAATDVTNDDLDDLIDVPILPLPAESTEVTDDDLASIRAPILSPGDPVSIPSLTGQTDSAVPPTELSSPSIVEIVQEQEAIETLGNLTAPKVTDPLALFKKLRDLAEELPHNVYYAFKASRMCATLDEIIADFEA